MNHDDNSRIALFPSAAIKSSESFFGENNEVLLDVRRPKPFCGNMVPRKTGFYHLAGHPERKYKFGGETWTSEPASPECEEVAKIARNVLDETSFVPTEGFELNTVVAQVYDGEQGAIAWHADDEKSMKRLMGPEGEMEVGPIVSVSFGASCKFSLRPIEAERNEVGKGRKRRKTEKKLLQDGDALVMKQGLQERYHHGIQKGDISKGTRICLTFRAQM
jgi:alkylated DNA repair dioxygenase AlkB